MSNRDDQKTIRAGRRATSAMVVATMLGLLFGVFGGLVIALDELEGRGPPCVINGYHYVSAPPCAEAASYAEIAGLGVAGFVGISLAAFVATVAVIFLAALAWRVLRWGMSP